MLLGACTEAQRTTFAMEGVALRWASGQVFATWDEFVAGFTQRFCQEMKIPFCSNCNTCVRERVRVLVNWLTWSKLYAAD